MKTTKETDSKRKKLSNGINLKLLNISNESYRKYVNAQKFYTSETDIENVILILIFDKVVK